MGRTVKDLRKLMKDIPDEAIVWGYEGEECGIIFSLYGECNYLNDYKDTEGEHGIPKTAFLDNEDKAKDEEWK